MSEVIIAYFNQTWWLVQGVHHLHDMLAGTEPPELAITIVTCREWRDVVQLWAEPELGKIPWAINPVIIERLKTRTHTTVSSD